MSETGQPRRIAKFTVHFLIFVGTEIALVSLYELALSLNAFSGVEYLPPWVVAITPYLAKTTSPIPANVGLLIAIYYALSVFAILLFVLFCFRERTKKPNWKWLLALAAGLPLLLGPWLVGANLRTFKMAEFHLGNVSGHFAAAIGICIMTAGLCVGAFVNVKTQDGNRNA